jgi:8-oxo-dGTP diphosphatase
MVNGSSPSQLNEVLVAVFGVRPVTNRRDSLSILLWQRAKGADAGKWALPGGGLLPDEDVDSSARRQLAEKVDLTQVTHLEQTGVFSAPHRVPGRRTIATGFLGLVPLGADPEVPADTAWHPVDALPAMAFDHDVIAARAHERVRGKLSYTNIGFALAPPEFTMATLRRIYATALGHDVDPTNLQRILTRRGMLAATGTTAPPGPSGGRPAALYRFTVTELRVTDPFAAFRPPDQG